MLSLYDAIQDHQVNLQIWFFCILFSAILAWNQSTGFVYVYYVLRIISFILSQGSVLCIAIAYAVRVIPQWLIIMNREYWRVSFSHLLQADVVEENKRAAAFSWITGLCAASHVLGNLLALFLPEKYIFPVCCCFKFSISHTALILSNFPLVKSFYHFILFVLGFNSSLDLLSSLYATLSGWDG